MDLLPVTYYLIYKYNIMPHMCILNIHVHWICVIGSVFLFLTGNKIRPTLIEY